MKPEQYRHLLKNRVTISLRHENLETELHSQILKLEQK